MKLGPSPVVPMGGPHGRLSEPTGVKAMLLVFSGCVRKRLYLFSSIALAMTRVTSFGRKRTHLQAGFDNEPGADLTNANPQSQSSGSIAGCASTTPQSNSQANNGEGSEAKPAKKKRKRTPKSKRDGHAAEKLRAAIAEGKVAEGGGSGKSKSIVGICYRCGSTTHSLSRCRKHENPEDPYPFASCFVCSGTGHLASACPQNKARGIYPNGGCCKLCNETTHLAKDCQLKKTVVHDPSTLIGTGKGTGADEDDFHVIKRKTGALDEEEKKALERIKNPRTAPPAPKKAVLFN